MKVIVMGAGVVGVSSAWYLAQAGHEVVVLDRQGVAAAETSFANGGQISVSQSEPWSNPTAPRQILKWLGRDDAPLLFRLQPDPRQWSWGLRFLAECRAGRSRRNLAQILQLGLYSRQSLQALRAETGLEYQQQLRGIACLYQTQQELDEAAELIGPMAELGVERQLLSPAELVAVEPALAGFAPRLAGGIYCPSDESGNARLFTRELAGHCAARGVRFDFHTRINGFELDGDRIAGVSVTGADGEYRVERADAYVLALGSYSPLLARQLGLRLPIYPAKGYSATLSIREPAAAPTVSITDEAAKIVFSRLGDTLRVAGTAELNGYSTTLDPVRCQALIRRAQEIFPEAADYAAPQFWTGLRPATPSNVPLIGPCRRHPNLFLNTGHGTLGWTGGPGSGRLLADLVSGRAPDISFPLHSF